MQPSSVAEKGSGDLVSLLPFSCVVAIVDTAKWGLVAGGQNLERAVPDFCPKKDDFLNV